MITEMKNFYLKSLPVFRLLSEQQLCGIEHIARLKQVFRGEILDYGSGEFSKIFFVVKGKIKLTELDELDNELVKDILTEGEVFGDIELEGDAKNDEFAQVLTNNTIVCMFRAAEFRDILEAHPVMGLSYAKGVSMKLKRLETRHADLVFRDAKSRLIRFIKNWARVDGSYVGGKIILNNYLTHSDIAGCISTSRQSVNGLLNELRDAGMLFYNRKKIELNDARDWN